VGCEVFFVLGVWVIFLQRSRSRFTITRAPGWFRYTGHPYCTCRQVFNLHGSYGCRVWQTVRVQVLVLLLAPAWLWCSCAMLGWPDEAPHF
jgi:hypothetical protein